MAKGIPFKYGRGQCIFCTRQPPEVKISNEHLFGDWLRELFPRDAGMTHTHGIITYPIRGSGLTKPVLHTAQKQGHTGSKKLRFVCKSCNETWLSNLVENAAKPILEQMLQSRPLMINREMQRVLATWAAKTAMVAEYVNPDLISIKQPDRTALKEKSDSPTGMVGVDWQLRWPGMARTWNISAPRNPRSSGRR